MGMPWPYRGRRGTLARAAASLLVMVTALGVLTGCRADPRPSGSAGAGAATAIPVGSSDHAISVGGEAGGVPAPAEQGHQHQGMHRAQAGQPLGGEVRPQPLPP